MDDLRIGCVVMAAGNAVRFGENKLTATLDGKALIRRTLDAIPPHRFARVVVVTQYPKIAELAASCGFSVVENRHPDWGISHTVALGLTALGDMDAALFQVSDQPLLTRQSLEGMLLFYRRHPDHIIAMGHGGVRGNPCLFPARFFPELLSLTGDHGGSRVIRRHEEDLLLFEVPARELADVDTPEELGLLRQHD